jgi:photosystem II stability/assembly factor-like uncharacterized protein
MEETMKPPSLLTLCLTLALIGLASAAFGQVLPVTDDEAYLTARAEHIARLRGLPTDNPAARARAIEEMQAQERRLGARLSTSVWTSIGPAPIPNGQVEGPVATPVSGRVSAIAVHPTNPNIVYVGAAQGGVYRSLDGGTSWVPIFDDAQSLAIGAIAIAPSDPSTVFVGTGEANFSCDSFFGVGIYRISNADTAPVLAGPFNRNGSDVDVMTGRSISKIVVHPTDPNSLFVATTSGVAGVGCLPFTTLPARGLFRSTNALGAAPTFTKLTVASGADDRSITDLVMDPGNANTLVAVVRGANVAGDGGVYRSTNALAASPVFTQTLTFSTTNVRGQLAINNIASTVTMLVASGEGSGAATCGVGGTLRRSTDGGGTWSPPLPAADGFCSGQCFYDIAVAIDPTSANNVLLGGQSPGTCSKLIARSTTAGATFTDVSTGVHVDTHVVVYAPSNSQIVYMGTDGGIYKSTNGGGSWTSMNTATFNATQFQSLALHPLDREFMIGGTQDNGTELKKSDGTWTRADFGDGGFALIDRNATDTTNVTMYHTYFNQPNSLIGFARVNTSTCATEAQWSFKGVYTGLVDPTVHCDGTTDTFNGISIGDPVLFYAPMALGPGTPSTVYFGTDKLYRSTNRGDAMAVVSQVFDPGIEVSAIGISPQNDGVRIVGLRNGRVFRTTIGSTTLTDVSGPIPAFAYIARAVVDPNDVNTAYVTLSDYGHLGQQIWKTTDLGSATPTWVAASAGIPDVPVSAFVVDPRNSSLLYAGTDIGVYRSTDGGVSWSPYSAGLPRVAVFDMAIQDSARVLRIATHGRGIWEIAPQTFADVPTTDPFFDFIERLFRAGITVGCATEPPQYCPTAAVTREQMAVFLERGLRGAGFVPPAATGIFVDVPTDNLFAPWIEQLYNDGITTGCATSPRMYCPTASVTRAEMAVFLVRAKHGTGFVPPPATGIFTDVPPGDAFAPWIEQLYNDGITTGCATGPLMYCPTASVTRGEMAVFLVRTFGL